MSIIWDIISLSIIAICIYIGVKRGFVSSILNLLCYVAAFLLGKFFAPLLSVMAYDNFLGDEITTIIANKITIAIDSGAIDSKQIAGMLPGWITGIINTLGIDIIQPSIDFLLEQITPEMIDSTARSISISISDVVTEFLSWTFFILIFFIALFILQKLIALFTFVNNIPIVGSINMVLGGATGVVSGLMFVMIIGAAAIVLGIILGGETPLLAQPAIESSLIIGTLKRILLKDA